MNKENFKKQGYCVDKSAISDELRDYVTQYALFDEMRNFNPEGIGKQVANAHSKYADPAMETMLLHIHKIMEKHTGLTLYPTYSYYRVYRSGDDLKPHVDRPACEISATMCFNYSYDVSKYSWPIFIDNSKIDLHPGDLAIYRGCDLSHWRESFNGTVDDWHVQGFFHFVDANGPYADHKFDKRENVGAIKDNELIHKIVKKSYIQYTK